MSEHVCEKKHTHKKDLSFQKAHAPSCRKSLVLKQTTFLSFEIKALTTNFLGLGNSGLELSPCGHLSSMSMYLGLCGT